MLARPVTLLGQQVQPFQNGDVLALGQSITPSDTTVAINPVTGQVLMQPYTLRAPASASADVLDTAANIVAAIQNALGLGGIVPNGTSWVTRVICTTAFAITYSATANTGVTVTRGVVTASSTKDFLMRVVNGSPLRNCSGLTANASAVVSGLTAADCRNLSVGMIVTNAVAGLQGTTIIAINAPAGTVTMSGNANADNLTIPVAITFSPRVTMEGIGQGLSA